MKSIVLCDDTAPQKVLALCQKEHLGIEIQGFYDSNLTPARRKEIEASYEALLPKEIEKHFHAPFWDLCLASKTFEIAEVTRNCFHEAYCTAEKLGCQTMTVHQGFIPGTSFPQGWTKRAIAFWNSFLDDHPGTLCICMENLLEQDPEALIRTIDGVSSDRLAVNLDIGHAYCHSPLAITEWIKQLNKRIRYVHLHQNNGESDEHLGLAYGSMNLPDVLDALEHYAPNAVWALECKLDHMEDSVRVLHEMNYLSV